MAKRTLYIGYLELMASGMGRLRLPAIWQMTLPGSHSMLRFANAASRMRKFTRVHGILQIFGPSLFII